MTEKGVVTEIRDKVATIQLEVLDACEACLNSGCKGSRQSIKAWNRDGLKIAEGDKVEVEVEGKAQAMGAFWVLGLPLALFVAGYFAGRALFPAAAGSGAAGEGPAALAGLFGLVLGMVIGVAVQRGKRLESLPRISRVVPVEVVGDKMDEALPPGTQPQAGELS
jgi:positive regulator of sigma E activity